MLSWLESSHLKLSLILKIEQGVACLHVESTVGQIPFHSVYSKNLMTISCFAEDYIRRDSCKYLMGLGHQFTECLVCISTKAEAEH